MKDHVIRNFEELLSLIFALIVVTWIGIGTVIGLSYTEKLGVYAMYGGIIFGSAIGYLVAVASTGVVYILLSINDHLGHIRSNSGSDVPKSYTF